MTAQGPETEPLPVDPPPVAGPVAAAPAKQGVSRRSILRGVGAVTVAAADSGDKVPTTSTVERTRRTAHRHSVITTIGFVVGASLPPPARR